MRRFRQRRLSGLRLEYRQRAFDYLALANETQDPKERSEMLSLAKMWLYLSEPVDDMPGHYELPKHRPMGS
jgi:hypothetical protein